MANLPNITDNRNAYTITNFTVGAAAVNFAFLGRPCSYGDAKTGDACAVAKTGDACAVIPAFWQSIKKSTGATERVTGDDYVGAVFERGRWLLCSSYYKGAQGLSTSFIR